MTGWVKSLIYTKNTWSCIMTSTGYYRLPSNQDRLLPTTLYTFYPLNTLNTLKIHGCVFYHLPVPTGYLMIRTGHYRRLYMRFTQWGQVLQNTLKIHGCVLLLLPVTTDHFTFVLYKNWDSGRPARYLGLRPGRALPTVRIIVPSSPMVLVLPNITVHTTTSYM